MIAYVVFVTFVYCMDVPLQSFFVWMGVEGGKDVVVHSIMELGELLS